MYIFYFFRLGFILDPASVNDDLQDLNFTLPITTRIFVHFSGSALVQPTCADSLIRLMARERHARTSSQGNTLGRGEFSNLNYMGEIMCDEGHAHNTNARCAVGSEERSGWSLTKDGVFIESSTSLASDCFNESWKANHIPPSLGEADNVAPSSSPLRCGFYWYRNTCLSRHSGGGALDHSSLLENMAALCSNRDDCLSVLCQDILSNDHTETLQDQSIKTLTTEYI